MVEQSGQFLLYGANGYTGRLIASMAAKYSLQPILAGRNEKEIGLMADQLQYPYRIVDLTNKEQLITILKEVSVVLHAAGPFHRTAKPMMDACLQSGTHYLDITGEIPVFEMAKLYHTPALKSGIMIMPGVGFDVVPTDCLSLFLKDLLPHATRLQLAFASLGGGLSHGTATTMAESLGEGSAARVNGKLIKTPLGHKGMWVDFGEKKLFVMTIPWGDISTAYHTTGIPNIETFTGVSPNIYRLLKWQPLFNWALKTSLVRNYLKKKINQRPAGPSDEARVKAKSVVWGQVQNATGKTMQATLTGPDGYTLTAHSSLIIVKKVLAGSFQTGYQTPAGAYGADLILEVPGTSRKRIETVIDR
jgi:short subunit dehydrogenase-like uncharacterized protein